MSLTDIFPYVIYNYINIWEDEVYLWQENYVQTVMN